MDEIVNRVAKSNLKTIDLEDWYPKGVRAYLDVKDWLFHGLILKEKDFREAVKNHDWSQYQDQYLLLGCSSDAIIPSWAYMLICIEAAPFAKKVVNGDEGLLNELVYESYIQALDVEEYRDKPVIIKGCANKPVPESAYLTLIQKLQPYAKTIMFGEACSSVPLYKRSR